MQKTLVLSEDLGRRIQSARSLVQEILALSNSETSQKILHAKQKNLASLLEEIGFLVVLESEFASSRKTLPKNRTFGVN